MPLPPQCRGGRGACPDEDHFSDSCSDDVVAVSGSRDGGQQCVIYTREYSTGEWAGYSSGEWVGHSTGEWAGHSSGEWVGHSTGEWAGHSSGEWAGKLKLNNYVTEDYEYVCLSVVLFVGAAVSMLWRQWLSTQPQAN